MDFTTLTISDRKQIPNPPNFIPLQSAASALKGKGKARGNAVVKSDEEADLKLKTLRQKKGWDMALAPAKSVPIQGFMLWMSGNTIQIFSGMAVLMLFKNAITGALQVNKVFLPLQSVTTNTAEDIEKHRDELFMQKAVYVLCQGLLLALAVYKVHTMGLLPTHESDWLAWQSSPRSLEMSEVSMRGV